MYSAGAQKRIMLIHDMTQELPASALRQVLNVFSLNPGDKLSLCGVFQPESKLKRLASIDRKNSVQRYSVDMDVLNKKKKQYENSWEIMQLSKLCDTQKVGFSLEIASGPSRSILAVEAAKKSRATWVILDRKMKKDKNYFLKNLFCGISKMKQHNCIAQIRGPVLVNESIQPKMVLQTSVCTENEDDDDDLFSIEITDYKLEPSHKVSDAIAPLSESTSTKEGHNESTREMLLASSPPSTRASDNTSEHEFISYIIEVTPRHELNREISKLTRQISYNEMIC